MDVQLRRAAVGPPRTKRLQTLPEERIQRYFNEVTYRNKDSFLQCYSVLLLYIFHSERLR